MKYECMYALGYGGKIHFGFQTEKERMTQEMITQATSNENKTKTTFMSLFYILANII
jgi:hypothetical protein